MNIADNLFAERCGFADTSGRRPKLDFSIIFDKPDNENSSRPSDFQIPRLYRSMSDCSGTFSDNTVNAFWSPRRRIGLPVS
jgi:hypothetical protein